jgi:dTDP-4-dehydrorhamnose 3,5-epimerase
MVLRKQCRTGKLQDLDPCPAPILKYIEQVLFERGLKSLPMDFSLLKTALDGVFQIQCKVSTDNRGRFIKNFRASHLKELGLETQFVEEFVTTSSKNVVRGLHFQSPPEDYIKIVSCFGGEILDVVVDLRKGSPTYGKHERFHLKEDSGRSIYIPKGFAHGFLALSDHATVHYQVSVEYAPSCDTGILWDSAGIEWPVESPIISARDSQFVGLKDFQSPFVK